MTQTDSRPARHSLSRDLFELLGSMRFAISLLVFICVASIVGTVLPQNRPLNTYVDQFGPFWFEVFDKFSLWHVYNSWWFLLIMGFLVVSTSICVIRHAPKMLRDAASFREHVREGSLRAFPERVELALPETPEAAEARLRGVLRSQGYAVRERREAGGVLLAAKKGSSNRLGYIFAHLAMVVICIGGLLDSELLVRLQVLFGGKQPIVENMLIADVPASGRLPLGNPSFRANVLVPEGAERNTALVMVDDGVLVQPLPFTIKLEKFDVDYYSTGMPSRFASHVEIIDPDDGSRFKRVIEVNEPLRYKGVTVYQSNLDDGGSAVTLTGYPLRGTSPATFQVEGVVGESNELNASVAGAATDSYKLNVTALRPINVEDIGEGGAPTPPRSGLSEHVAAVTGSAAGRKNERLRNLGPTVEYQLIDDAGQAQEYRIYMVPVDLDGLEVFLAGVRENPSQNYAYLRIPADEQGSLDEFMQLRAALADPAVRAEAVHRFVERNLPPGADRAALTGAASRGLDTFANGGLRALSELLEGTTDPADVDRAANVVLRLLNSTLFDVRAIMRERQGMPALADSGAQAEQQARWQQAAMAALSDLALYPAPVLLTLSDFQQVQASGFQVSRTPGKNAVYLGCLLLILGVFAMFYIRDRRVWIWIKPQAQGSEVKAAMTSQKRTLDYFQEFERFRAALGPSRGEQ